ncbi:hypothetical protein JHD50_08545 [Sulfurimonas sp. MAG313]|nr:hypothetical protein [Sulfurimonas sp. MAG313]MDF1881347.1 hypothetical protein [Sulfurimonas sp. MAG313]
MKFFQNLFGTKKIIGINLNISKNAVMDMKDSTHTLQDKIESDLKKSPDIVDRRILMRYEKRFIDKFKKIGNLNQKCPYCSKAYQSLNLGEKKCGECKKTFFVQKRVQDMGTVAVMLEKKPQFDLQWKATSQIKKFKFFLPNEYSYIEKQLQGQGKKNLQSGDVMHSLLNAYAKNSLNAGHYELYMAFIFHKAELMRSQQRFAEALECYLYVYFLQSNLPDNEANFSQNLSINEELRQQIAQLLEFGNIQIKKLKDLFDYAIKHLNVFNESSLTISAHKSYSLLMKEFKEEDANKEEIKPMRSFVLYTKAS